MKIFHELLLYCMHVTVVSTLFVNRKNNIYSFSGEHIRNWRRRYFVLRSNGTFTGYREAPTAGTTRAREPLNDFTVKGELSQ